MSESDRVCRAAVDDAQAKNDVIQKDVNKLVTRMNQICPAAMKCANERFYCNSRWFKHTNYCSCARVHCALNGDCERMNANIKKAKKSCPPSSGGSLSTCDY